MRLPSSASAITDPVYHSVARGDPDPGAGGGEGFHMAEARNGGVTIFYETFGDAGDPALLLVNGLGSQCTAYRREWCERFTAEGFFVIRFDNRDVGLSTHLSDVAPDVLGVSAAVAEGRTPSVPYVLADMADDAVAVLDDLGIDRAHVMGLSMGGMIVQQLAIAHPERLRSLTSVMSTTGDPDVGQAHREARALLFGPPATTREEAIARAVQGLHVWGSPEHLDDERTASIAAEAYDRAFDPAGQARQLMGILASPSRTEALRDVDVPALVLHGDRDRLVDISGGRRTAEAIPDATFEVMEGMGHDYPPAYWDRWVRLVTDHAHAADRAAADAA
jgi:pimeloyl-ACP methyl ester carboxylesterase